MALEGHRNSVETMLGRQISIDIQGGLFNNDVLAKQCQNQSQTLNMISMRNLYQWKTTLM